MYEFIRIQYQMGVVGANQVRAFAPRWITAEQAEEILTEGEAQMILKRQ